MDGVELKSRRAKFPYCHAVLICACIIYCAAVAQQGQQPEKASPAQVVVITCYGMIDDGLYQSIVRRSNEAIKQGADFVILEVQTYGGLVESADDISKYLIHSLAKKVRTIAYVSTEAISAGAMISVSCQDIVMKENTTIGASAPIVLGSGEMGEAEREKQESFVRATFSRAAQANGYPEALLWAMVSQNLEIWEVENLKTGKNEYFEKNYLPNDPNTYSPENKKLVVREGELLTLTDKKALEYGIARAIVNDIDGVLDFIETKYKAEVSHDVLTLRTIWSEELVRWLNSPVVTSILIMGILIGIYAELHTPGLGLAGLVALICFVTLVGSKYLIGMANWIEVAILVLGIILLLLELFVIPGFGVAGIAGIILIIGGLLALMVKNAPGEIPWPRSEEAWDLFTKNILAFAGAFVVFIIAASIMARYLPKISFLSGLTLKPSSTVKIQIGTHKLNALVNIGDTGIVETTLRPVGTARFNGTLIDVVCQAEFIQKHESVQIIEISGNRIVVKRLQEKA